MASLLGRRALLLTAGLVAVGCLSPTLPMPPPADPNVSGPDENGVAHLTGYLRPHAWIFALNTATETGYFQGTGDDGRYDLEIRAQVGDPIELWYKFEGEESESLRFTIREPKP